MLVGDAIQFNDKHKWFGCLGFIVERKECGDDVRYMVGVPMPLQGTAYIYVMGSENALEYIGNAVFIIKQEED